jgi:hypothetical protein
MRPELIAAPLALLGFWVLPLAMLAGMLLGGHQNEVLKPVVPLVPIDVMDKFKAAQSAPEFMFHQPAMLI